MDGLIPGNPWPILNTHTLIMLLWIKGFSAREISLKTGASLSTVYRWIRLWRKQGPILDNTCDINAILGSYFVQSHPIMNMYPHTYPHDPWNHYYHIILAERGSSFFLSRQVMVSMIQIRMICYALLLLLNTALMYRVFAINITSNFDDNMVLPSANKAVDRVFGRIPGTKCLPLIITDQSASHNTMYKEMVDSSGWGVGVFKVFNIHDTNETQSLLSTVVTQARKLRKVWWCVTVIVMSDNPAFLIAFAQWSLKGRLLVWSTKLLVVTRLARSDLVELLSSHWTFSMMNTMVLNADISSQNIRYGVFVHLPYSKNGQQIVQLTSWTPEGGFFNLSQLNFFPEKFHRFHGGIINVTALPYEPYWMESKHLNITTYSGIDYNLLTTLSQALNFSFRVLPSKNWAEVTDQVEARTSFIASIVYVILPGRLERWDFTTSFDNYSPLCFALAKPVLRPDWLSCYYPFSDEVWAGILISTIIISFTLVTITKTNMWQSRHGKLSVDAVVLEALGSLLGQGLYARLSTCQSNHLLVGTWLIFSVVVGAGYRGSLIASLTLPRLPTRPENVEQLITKVDRVTMDSWGGSYKDFFLASELTVFQKLGGLMDVGTGIIDGLNEALTTKQAHMGGRQYIQLTMAQHFTMIDGSSPIYIGREMIIPSTSAWPVPHDAPYTHILDKSITAIIEAGLYDQWRKEMIEAASRQSRIKQREDLRRNPNKQLQVKKELEGRSLTVAHIQGPLGILALGLTLACLSFITEKVFLLKCWSSSQP